MQPEPELFDTVDYSPLFSGIPVPATEPATKTQHGSFAQPAFFCFRCHQGGGQLLLARDGHRYCQSCALLLNRRSSR